ncbi:uncharacterized protein LOC113202876 isoform X1 [Frankliniella occidentalis]|uniref:Uncharacterized protein LOC113202876 isoform X1 n=1 Tax=Frankliniella occidentalis TaxID=133901 RepID=A0A9C6TWK1_FRAOC|nr:uncharacterized protein LOC113202876 isoform X1 [Frankliniella occidentalis]
MRDARYHAYDVLGSRRKCGWSFVWRIGEHQQSIPFQYQGNSAKDSRCEVAVGCWMTCPSPFLNGCADHLLPPRSLTNHSSTSTHLTLFTTTVMMTLYLLH